MFTLPLLFAPALVVRTRPEPPIAATLNDPADQTPYFETPSTDFRWRMLLISWSFPPSGHVGALRWEGMLRFASTRGWSADVISLAPDHLSASDRTRLERLGPGMRLYGVNEPRSALDALLRLRRRAKSGGPGAASATAPVDGDEALERSSETLVSRFLRNAKGSILAHDYYRKWEAWAVRVARLGTGLGIARPYDVVISSGPPHMAHESARLVARDTGVPFCMDLRDLWTGDHSVPVGYREKSWRALSDRLERRCIAAASRIIMNTDLASEDMRRRYPDAASRIITVMNGADGPPMVRKEIPRPFTIAYTGSIYGGRRVESLFRATRTAIGICQAGPSDLVVHFMGVDEAQRSSLLAVAEREGILANFRCDTLRPRAEALALLDRSALLVVLPQVHAVCMPAKVFEYVQRPAWVLALTEPGTATADGLAGTEAAIVHPADVEGITRVIASRYRAWQHGGIPAPLNSDGRFARDLQAAKLLSEMDTVVSAKEGPRVLSRKPKPIDPGG